MITRHVEAVAHERPLLEEERVWAAADGLKSPLLQQNSNWLKQNVNHNGQLSHTCVNSVFVFAPDGSIRCAMINHPDSWQDSIQAGCGIHDIHGELNGIMPFMVQGWLSTQLLGCNQTISQSSQDKNKTQLCAAQDKNKTQLCAAQQEPRRQPGLCCWTKRQHP